METREILERLKKGELSLEEAEGALRCQPFEDLGYAKLGIYEDGQEDAGRGQDR